MCLRPRMMYDTGRVNPDTGKAVYTFKPPLLRPNALPSIPVPCGKCIECRTAKRLEWCKRMQIQLLASPDSSFITLTYRDPPPPFLVKSDLQRFFKRLRHADRDFGIDVSRLKYFAVGEYGSKFGRPHYHAILFGLDLMAHNPTPVSYKDGFPIFSSPLLERYWPFGYNTCDRVTARNIRYVSKYVAKGSDSLWSFAGHDEFYLASQGLGRDLFVDASRHGRQSFMRPLPLLRQSFDNGCFAYRFGDSPKPLPRFLDRYFERFYPDDFAVLKDRRKLFARSRKPETVSPIDRARFRESQIVDEIRKRRLDHES